MTLNEINAPEATGITTPDLQEVLVAPPENIK